MVDNIKDLVINTASHCTRQRLQNDETAQYYAGICTMIDHFARRAGHTIAKPYTVEVPYEILPAEIKKLVKRPLSDTELERAVNTVKRNGLYHHCETGNLIIEPNGTHVTVKHYFN